MKRAVSPLATVRYPSIATECGFGCRRPETIDELLAIHVEAAERQPDLCIRIGSVG